MNNDLMFSSKTDDWATPQWLFDEYNQEFQFNLDVCATADNHKCELYYDAFQDGLSKEWKGNVWCNPPYGRQIGKWVEKAYWSYIMGDAQTIVMLLPARTDTKWFHSYLYETGVELRFLKGRLKFGNATNSAPFPSMVAIFRPDSIPNIACQPPDADA